MPKGGAVSQCHYLYLTAKTMGKPIKDLSPEEQEKRRAKDRARWKTRPPMAEKQRIFRNEKARMSIGNRFTVYAYATCGCVARLDIKTKTADFLKGNFPDLCTDHLLPDSFTWRTDSDRDKANSRKLALHLDS